MYHVLGIDHLTCRGGGGYGLLFRSEFLFRTTRELEYYFFCRAKREFFFRNITLGYMTKVCLLIRNCLLWPKEKGQKDKQRSTKHTHKIKDRETRTTLCCRQPGYII
jgi:hypothetical protein